MNVGVYDFTKALQYDIVEELDKDNFRKLIKKKLKCEKDEKDEETVVLLKKLIKHETNFKELLMEVNYEMKEFLKLSVQTFPQMWNHHLTKFVRKNYLFKEKSELEKL